MKNDSGLLTLLTALLGFPLAIFVVMEIPGLAFILILILGILLAVGIERVFGDDMRRQ